MNEIISRENIQKGEINMGGGRWTRNTFDAYSARLGRAVDATGKMCIQPRAERERGIFPKCLKVFAANIILNVVMLRGRI